MDDFTTRPGPASGGVIWLRVLLLMAVQCGWTGAALAAVYAQPAKDAAFAITGFIGKATLDAPADPLSGGTVTVNGTQVVIPKNTRVLMPGRFLTWQELWAKAPPPWGLITNGGNGQTGLALTDREAGNPLATYEITVQGNCIPNPGNHPKLDPVEPGAEKCTHVAGLVSIAQQSPNAGQGVINYIDYAHATLHVGGPIASSSVDPANPPQPVSSPGDTLIQINDPAIPGLPSGGRYSKGQTPDERFATDQDNPAIRAQTGYPMCIPRVTPPQAAALNQPLTADDDPECPQKNRPLDPNATPPAPLGSFTLGSTANAAPAGLGGPAVPAPAHALGDPTKQAPFQVGDHIEFAGTLQTDADGTVTGCTSPPCTYISAHQIVATLGIYTSPNANPAYLAVEDTLLGVGGTPINFPNAVPQEATGRMKVVGFFTDPTRTVDIYAVQVDPCSGAETLKPLLLGVGGRVVPWGRFRDVDRTCPIAGAAGCGSPPTREWNVRYSDFLPSNTLIGANGLKTKQYQIPVGEFITPENTVFGDPVLRVIPNNFQEFPFLVDGSGPLNGTGPIVGPLDPFPMTNSIPGLTPQVLHTVSCTPGQAPPLANAGANQTVDSGATVTLNGDASSDPNNLTPLNYVWTQTSGPMLAGFPTAPGTTPSVSFTAPTVAMGATPVNFTFQLTVTNSADLSATATTAVTVAPPPSPPGDTITLTGAVYKVRQHALNVTATSSASTDCTAILTMTADTGFSSTMACTPGTGGSLASYTFSSKPVTQPNFVTVTSSLRGTATRQVNLQ